MGEMVPMGNGDDPTAVGLVNRLYARVRNYGSAAAANVVVHFDISNAASGSWDPTASPSWAR